MTEKKELEAKLAKKEKQLTTLKAMPPNVPHDLYRKWADLCRRLVEEIGHLENELMELKREGDVHGLFGDDE